MQTVGQRGVAVAVLIDCPEELILAFGVTALKVGRHAPIGGLRTGEATHCLNPTHAAHPAQRRIGVARIVQVKPARFSGAPAQRPLLAKEFDYQFVREARPQA